MRVGRLNLGVNTSFVVFRVGSTWIDCGPPNRWRQLQGFAQEERPQTVLLTHHHEDHSGNAARLQAQYGARVLAPARSLPLLRSGFPIQFYRRQVWGVPPTLEAEALPAEFEDRHGVVWQTIPAPGHAEDMVCFFQPERGWLFSADLYVASRIKYGRPEDRLHQEIESLRRVLALPFGQLFCSHRGPVENGRQALSQKLDYLIGLREEAQSLRARGWSIAAIQRQLLGREDLVSYLSGFHFCKRNLIRACLAPSL